MTDRTTVFCVTRSSLSRRRWKDTWESTRESGRSAVPSASWGSSARLHWNDILRLTPGISRRWRTVVIWSKGWVATHLGCVKCQLALHGVAAYLMVCSSAAVYKADVNKDEAVNTHTTQNNKIKHLFAIHCLLRPPSCKHAHSRGATANCSSELFKHFICFIKCFTQEGVTWYFAAANSRIIPSCWVG